MNYLASGPRAQLAHFGVTVEEDADICNLLEVHELTQAQARSFVKANKGNQQDFKSLCGFREGQEEADLAGQSLKPGHAMLLAWDLTKGHVSSSMNKLNVLSNSIGDEGYEILTKVAEEKGILTLVGFDEGQTEADLSNKRLGLIDAKLIAWELTTGVVSTSMNSLK